MFNNSAENVQVYAGTPVHMHNNKSLSKYTLQSSIRNIKKYENKQYLNILITNIEYLELLGDVISFCRVGITGIDIQQKKILAQFYSNRVLIVDQSINNSYIDIVITENKVLLNKLIHKNYIKYIYSINQKFPLQYYKAYQTIFSHIYFHINRLGVDAYKQIEFKLDKSKPNASNIIANTDKKIKQNVIQKPQIENIAYLCNKNTVSLIIPYLNNQLVTIKLLKSIQRYSKNSIYKINIILISDHSNQQKNNAILNQIKKYKFLTYQFILNQKRLGYIKSINKGITKALQNESQYIVLMHNDIQVSYNWQNLLLNLKNNIVATCPLTNSQYNTQQNFRYIRTNKILQNFPQSFQKCKTLTINEKLEIYKNKNILLNKQTFIPDFFCIAFKAQIFKHLGLLDQSFGQGFGQNIDFIYKIYNNNYNIAFIPSVYIPHIGRTTFKDLYPVKQLNKQIALRLKLNKFNISLNNQKSKKRVIYTCITKNYDNLKHSVYNTEQFDYIYFGQKNQNIPQPWKFINIQPFLDGIGTSDPIKIARFFKTHPHLFFRNYEQSLWIDGNIDIITDPANLFDLFLDQQYIMIPRHPQRTSVYAEAQVCKAMNKDTDENINNIIKYLNQNDFKDQTGLVQSGIILRKHNNVKCKLLMENWWKLILRYSCRDQLSFNYCLQKSKQNILIIDWNIFNNKYIKWNGKHGNK